jgi:hypothetical protein
MHLDNNSFTPLEKEIKSSSGYDFFINLLKKDTNDFDLTFRDNNFLENLAKARENFLFISKDFNSTPAADLKQGYLEDLISIVKLAFPNEKLSEFKTELINKSLVSQFMGSLKFFFNKPDFKKISFKTVTDFIALHEQGLNAFSLIIFLIYSDYPLICRSSIKSMCRGLELDEKQIEFLKKLPSEPVFLNKDNHETFHNHSLTSARNDAEKLTLFFNIYKILLKNILYSDENILYSDENILYSDENILQSPEAGKLSCLLYFYGINEIEFNQKNNFLQNRKNLFSLAFDPHEFKKYLNNKGLIYDIQIIKRLHLSLCSKPFLLLSGISGTGKTRLITEYAGYMTRNNKKKGYTIVSIKPEFDKSSHILGAVKKNISKTSDTFNNNSAQPVYLMRPALKIIIQALIDSENPYFLILDEMNIGQAEKYFADFLSAMESNETIFLHHFPQCIAAEIRSGSDTFVSASNRDFNNFENNFENNFICNKNCRDCFFFTGAVLHQKSQAFETCVPPRIKLPSNLLIAGTVNFDESGNTFSAKLIDRAHTIDMIKIDISRYFLTRSKEIGKYSDIFPKLEKKLKDIYAILYPAGLHFGYRVVKEIIDYTLNALKAGLYDESLFDQMICQKIMPRFYGKKSGLLTPLLKLFIFSALNEINNNNNNNNNSPEIIDIISVINTKIDIKNNFFIKLENTSEFNTILKNLTIYLNSDYSNKSLTAETCARMIINLSLWEKTNFI